MRFLHISDIHFNPNGDGDSTRNLRRKFEAYVREKKITKIDEIFFTGDFRHAVKQAGEDIDKVAESSVDFLRYIARCVGVKDDQHIHIVPGNHDLERYPYTPDEEERARREETSERKLKKIYESYEREAGQFQGMVDGERALDYLRSRFVFFEKCAALLGNKIWDNFSEGPIHHYRDYGEYGILYLNTAIASGRDNERYNLIIGRDDFFKAVDQAKGKPLFVLAHNPIYHLERKEEKRIKNILKDSKSPVVWFCGDIHDTDYDSTYEMACIAAGCMIKEEGTEASFYVGEFKNSRFTYIEAHGYKADHYNWQPEEALTKRIRESIPKRLNGFQKKSAILWEKYFGKIGILMISAVLGGYILLKPKLQEAGVPEAKESVEMELESEKTEGVGISYEDVTPLSMAGSISYGEKISEKRYVERQNAKDGFDKGCILKVSVDNQNEYAVEASDVTLVIDEIKVLEKARPIVLGYMYNNNLEIYMINDGKGVFDGRVQLSFRYYDEETREEDYLEDYVVERILSPRVFGKLESLEAGEISRIARYDVSCTELQNWMKEHYENAGIYVTAKVMDGYSGLEYEYDLGCLYSAGSARACLERSQGEEYEFPAENPVVIDVNNKTPVFFVKHFSLKKASEFPVFIKGFSLLLAGIDQASLRMRACSIR